MESQTVQQLRDAAEEYSVATLIKVIEVLSEVLERKTNG